MSTDSYNLSNIFNFFDIDFNWSDFAEMISNVRSTRKADKSIVNKQGTYYSLLSKALPDERFYTDIGSAHFECFFHKGSKDGLVVFFSQARKISGGKAMKGLPFFTRWSFYRYTDYSCLCIVDPMYYRFSECKIGWYFGTKTQNYRKSTAELINHIADVLDVPADKIFLYGSSAGGTAAIEISAFIKNGEGCNVISINPQLNFHEYHYSKKFVDDTGINLFDYESYGNNYNPVKTIQSSNSNVLLMVNIQSGADFNSSLKYLCEQLSIKPRYGLSKFDNLYIWCYDAVGSPYAHNSQDNNTLFRGILSVMNAIKSGEDVDEISGLTRLINEIWFERWNLIKKNNDLQKALTDKEKAKDVLKPANVYSFTLKKKSADPNSIIVNFSGESCIIYATRFFSEDANNVNAVVSFDYWNENYVYLSGDCGDVQYFKQRKSRDISIINNSPFAVAFVMMG